MPPLVRRWKLVGAALLALVSFAVATPVRGVEVAEPPQTDLVLFVQGLRSSWNCENAADPAHQVNALVAATAGEVLPAPELHVFSYSGDYPDCVTGDEVFYEPGDTCTSIDATANGAPGHSDRFREWYETVTVGHDAVHVMGHSMGGVVISHALAAWGTVPSNLRSVITLDSPLDGQELADAAQLLCGLIFGAVQDLAPGSVVVDAIQGMANERRSYVTAIGNNEDLIVWPSNSHLPAAWLNFRIDDQCADDFDDHQCVYTNERAQRAITASLRTPHAAGSRAPVPLELGSCAGQPANVIGSTGSDNAASGHELYGSDQPDVIVGGRGADVIVALGGGDLVCGGPGRDVIRTGPGRDTVNGGGSRDKVFGGTQADQLGGGGGPDILRGEAGADALFGGPGNDRLRGGKGPDALFGEDGDDTLDGGLGNDTCDGGPGDNTFKSC